MIVGLGNPGREYASTRHNVGRLAFDELIRQARDVGALRKKFHGEFAKGSLEGHECIFLRPETFMNESGRSVQAAAVFFHVAPSDLVVLHDELDLPFGEIRMKLGGGHAGHNGLRSLVQDLGTPDFVRVRIGIGRPPADFAGEVADYVLSAFSTTERPLVQPMIDRAAKMVLKIVNEGVARAMNEMNTRPKRQGEQGGAGEPQAAPPKATPSNTTNTTPRSQGEGKLRAAGI